MQFIQSFFEANIPIYMLFILMIADVFTGLLRAARDRRLASDVSMAGMTKKAGMLIAVGVLKVLQTYMPGLPLADSVALFYCGTEALSLIENLGQLNVVIPVNVRAYFAKLAPDQQGDATPEQMKQQIDELLKQIDDKLKRGRAQ